MPGRSSPVSVAVAKETSTPNTFSICWRRSGEGLKRGTTTSCCIPHTPSMHRERKRRMRPIVLLDSWLIRFFFDIIWNTTRKVWQQGIRTIPKVIINTLIYFRSEYFRATSEECAVHLLPNIVPASRTGIILHDLPST